MPASAPVSFIWFFGWRFLAGLTGGVIMVLAASTILPHTAPARRGFVGGVIFAGVGLGIAASGTLVPLLLQQGLRESWYGLGALSALLTLIELDGLAEGRQRQRNRAGGASRTSRPQSARRPRAAREYGLNALALVPHMVFLVDFVARGLGQGISVGSHYWVLYGIGAIVGPLLTGHLADRAGFGPALRVAFLVQAIAILLPALSTAPASMIVSSVVVGGFTPGIVPLVLGRIHELIPHSADAQRAAWGAGHHELRAVPGGRRLRFLLAVRASVAITLLFLLGGAAVMLALAIDLVMALTVVTKPPEKAR